jgi:hypothetical protein
MKTSLIKLLAFAAFWGWWGGAYATYGEIRTTWDSLPMLELPSLKSNFYEKIELFITKVPDGAYAHLDSYGACAQLCEWECDVSLAGTMMLLISNAYGYGERYAPCNTQLRIEFGVVNSGRQNVLCSLKFWALGSRILPKVRIGEVMTRPDGNAIPESNSWVLIYPQIQLVYPDPGNPLWVKPVWKAKIECPGMDSVWVTGWNDCSGMSKTNDSRSPCKPDPISSAYLRACNGIVKITFDPEIVGLKTGDDFTLQYESDELSFWYDLFNDKRVER